MEQKKIRGSFQQFQAALNENISDRFSDETMRKLYEAFNALSDDDLSRQIGFASALITHDKKKAVQEARVMSDKAVYALRLLLTSMQSAKA